MRGGGGLVQGHEGSIFLDFQISDTSHPTCITDLKKSHLLCTF